MDFRLLSKILAKGGDEAMEVADEVSQSAMMKNLAKEAKDATQPIGSGANLQALQKTSDDISVSDMKKLDEMQADAANAPFVDNEFSLNQENLGLSYDDVSRLKYSSPNIIKESKPSNFFPGAPALGEMDIEATNRMNPALRNILIAGGVLGAGSMMLPDEQVSPPMAKQQAPASSPAPQVPTEPEATPTAATMASIAPTEDNGLAPMADKLSAKLDEGMAGLPKEAEQEASYAELMAQAQNAQNQNQFQNNLLRAANQAGASIASLGAGAAVKADYGMVDALDKTAGRPVEQIKSAMDTKSAENKMKQAEREMNDEQKLRDPNSSASILTRNVLARHGLNVKTAKEAKDAGINVQNLILQELAAQKAKEVAEKQADVKAKSSQEKDDKFIQSLRKEATSGVFGKQYLNYTTAQRMGSAITEFAKDPSGYKDYAALMGGLKALQGDESVVREAEIRLGMQAGSLKDRAENFFSRQTTGKSLSNSQRQELIKTINTLSDLSKKQYISSIQPILKQAELKGYNPNLVIDNSLINTKSSESQESSGQYSPKEEAGIAAYMQAKSITRDEAISRLKTAGRIK